MKRTQQQNRAIHKWFEMIAEAWNESGYEQKLTFGTVDAPWTKEIVKAYYRKIGYVMFEKDSTADLTTKELTQVTEVLNRALAQQGIHVPFPSIEEILLTEESKTL